MRNPSWEWFMETGEIEAYLCYKGFSSIENHQAVNLELVGKQEELDESTEL